ncbi:MAG TPA: ATP-binding protein [Candidatus Polarisedimenticolaceae bacterium]|nr:ATP-binding protein [Candidatus Polarisedimenticolaceae bacterium]
MVEIGPDAAKLERVLEVGRVFTPTAPIDERSLFSGRDAQIRRVIDAVNQKGQHAIIFGERGVGKTSLANVLASFLSVPGSIILAPRINCDSEDSFDSVWRKVFELIETTKPAAAGFARTASGRERVADLIPGSITPNDVRAALVTLAQMSLPILIIDEFDRLNEAPRRAVADTIKSLSDHAVRATVVLVGVADSVDELIREHQSVERALVQIPMPRMSKTEIRALLETGADRLGMKFSEASINCVIVLAQGLPHYAHLLGLHAARAAIEHDRVFIEEEDITGAIQKSLADAQQSVRRAYHEAIRSPRPDNLFATVLLACALARTSDLGYFAAQEVRGPMRRITGKNYEIASFAQHLNEFSEVKRGPILQKHGERRRYVYRFINPLMQPYIIMQGVLDGRLEPKLLEELGS